MNLPNNNKSAIVKNIIDSNLVPVFSIAAAISAGMVGISALSTWNIYKNFQSAITKNFKLQDLSGQIVHLDEVLTMSARMAASTGDLKWEQRYQKFVPSLDNAIGEVLSIAPEHQENANQTDSANAKLIEMEDKAFELVRQGKSQEALKLLLGSEYSTQKAIYSQGIETTLTNIQTAVDNQIQTYGRQLSRSAILAGISFPILVISWILVLSLVRSYILDRNFAQESLKSLNLDLEKRVDERTKKLAEQEQNIRQETEILESDITKILETVSAIEEGDFRVQAPINDRITGLVSDTLNRLIEELSLVLNQVLKATDRVTYGTKQLDSMTNQVAANSQQEVRSVEQVLELADKVSKSALDSAEEIKKSIVSLQTLQASVNKGQDASYALTEGIGVLQQGTDKIVQQMKALGEFVGLTDQFLQEQSQISSMTQVLAMNASLVAARASEQKDPNQFVVVAREFESIANQVSNLAQRTSGGLVSLEQRSSQIHNVVNSIDANIQNLGGLVREFTQGVDKSTQVFQNVQKTASQAVQAGEAVALSSQQIINSAQLTTEFVGEISDLAYKTEALTQESLLRSQEMENLSSQLLTTIKFFQLPDLSDNKIDLSEIQNKTVEAKSAK